MKKRIIVCTIFITCLGVNLKAQTSPALKTKTTNPINLTLGLGSVTPSKTLKTEAYMQSLTAVSLGCGKTVLHKKWLSLSLSTTLSYLSGNKLPLKPSPINVIDQTSSTVVIKTDGKPRQKGLLVELGPTLNIHIIKGLVLSAGLELGFASLTNKAFTVVQNLDYNGSITPYTLLNVNETKIQSIYYTPSLQLKYDLGPITLWSSVDRIVWSPNSFKRSENKLQVKNNPAIVNGTLKSDLDDASLTAINKKVTGSLLTVSAGISIPIGKKNDYIGHVTLLR